MTKLLFKYIKQIKLKCQVKDNFEYDDWLAYLDALEETLASESEIASIEF